MVTKQEKNEGERIRERERGRRAREERGTSQRERRDNKERQRETDRDKERQKDSGPCFYSSSPNRTRGFLYSSRATGTN
eukprot:scaffold101343_cov67-Attheya_sp.AAC.3